MTDYRTLAQVQKMIDAVTAGVATPHSLELDLPGYPVRVETDSAALHAELSTYFREFRGENLPSPNIITALQNDAPPDFGDGRTMTIGEYKQSVKGPKEAFFDCDDGRVVSKLRTGMWFLFSQDRHVAVGPCEANPNQVINFINNRLIQRCLHQGMLLGHCSAVVKDGKAIAIAGTSGAGKSTLALHLMNRDPSLKLLSNDRVMFEKRGDGTLGLHGVPKHPRINPGTVLNNPSLASIINEQERARFLALPKQELWELEHKYDAIVDECFGPKRFVLAAQLVGLAILTWKPDAGAPELSMAKISDSDDLLKAVRKPPGVFYLPKRGQVSHRGFQSYVDFLDSLPVLHASGGADFDAAATRVLEML